MQLVGWVWACRETNDDVQFVATLIATDLSLFCVVLDDLHFQQYVGVSMLHLFYAKSVKYRTFRLSGRRVVN